MTDNDDSWSLPEDLPGRPRRSHPRYDLRQEVELRCKSWDEFLTLYTGNVSRAGVLVLMDEAPEVGESVDVRVQGPDGSAVTLAGQVARVEPRGDGSGQVGVGIHLSEPEPGVLLDILTQAHGTEREGGAQKVPDERVNGRWRSTCDAEAVEDIPLVDVDDLLEEPDEEAAALVQQVDARSAAPGARSPAVVGKAPAPVIGLDFGTTASKVAVVHAGEVVLLEDESSQAATRAAVPSVVAFREDGGTIVGHEARAMLATAPSRVVGSVKRVMGLDYQDRLAAGLLGSMACRNHAGPNGAILFDIDGRAVTVPEVAARIIEHVKGVAEKWAGAKVERAVLTVPVDFGERARKEVQLAAKMAGLEVVAMIAEPVAAAMGCGVSGVAEATVAVYDFGGGTFDGSVVDVREAGMRVRGAAGDRWLGGDDLDEALAGYVADEFHRSSGVDLHGRAEPWQRLLFACEDAKRWLSTLPEVDVILPNAATRQGGPLTLLAPVTRQTFDEACHDVIQASIDVCRQALDGAGIGPDDVDAVLVTGGTTRVPAVQEAVRAFYRREPIEGIHPEHSVVIGAAVHAAHVSKSPRQRLSRAVSERLRTGDSAAYTVGLALADGTTEHVIEASRRPPVAAHRLYSTSRDGQTQIRLEIMEGAALTTTENRRIGGFLIDGLPAAPAGAIDLDVYLELNSAGSLCVTAQERTLGHKVQETFRL